MDNRIFNVRMWYFLQTYAQGGPQFIVSFAAFITIMLNHSAELNHFDQATVTASFPFNLQLLSYSRTDHWILQFRRESLGSSE